MHSPDHFWAIILAAGDGKRLKSFQSGVCDTPAPKQFRSFAGHEPMVQWTIKRAASLIPLERTVCIVAEEHQSWWRHQLVEVPADNVIVQPANRGTAAGLLLPLFTVLDRDPHANILVLPSDHFAESEAELRATLSSACRHATENSQRVVLIGIEPDRDMADYGWIVPGRPVDGQLARRVHAFCEKPDPRQLQRLLQRGALINSLILAASGQALLRLFVETVPELLHEFASHWLACGGEFSNLQRLYESLSPCDFSRAVLERAPRSLLVVPAPSTCGWADLGTPARIRSFLDRHQATAA